MNTTVVDSYSRALQYAARLPRAYPKITPANITNDAIHPRLRGTKLAADLLNIQRRFGYHDSVLRGLTEKALGGGNIPAVFESIRDRLTMHANPYDAVFAGRDPLGHADDYRREAHRLSREYNWHRVSNQLNLDHAVKEYIDRIAKERIRGQHLRAAHNLFGFGWESRSKPVSKDTYDAFWGGLRKHLKGTKGYDYSGFSKDDVHDDLLRKSLRRLGDQEENLATLGTAKKVVPGKAESPAYATSLEGDYESLPTSHSHQYARDYAAVLRYAGRLVPVVDPFSHVSGIHYTGYPNGKYDADNHIAAQMERTGLKHAMLTLGLVPPKDATESRAQYTDRENAAVADYITHIREYVHSNPKDTLSRYYLRTAQQMRVTDDSSKSLSVGIGDLSRAVAPLVRKIATDRGVLSPRLIRTEPGPKSVPPLPPEPNYDADVIDLAEPQHHEDYDTAAAEYLGSKEKTKPLRAAVDRGSFGGGKLPYEEVPHEGDFDLPETEYVGGPNADIDEIEATPKLASVDDNRLLALRRQLERVADDTPIPLAKRKRGGQFKQVLRNYGVEPTAPEPVPTTEPPIPLAKGRVKKMPSKPATPPEPPLKLRRTGPVARYGEEFAGFHNHIIDSYNDNRGKGGSDPTHALVYADHLQEQGKEAHAEMLRQNAAEFGDSGIPMHYDLRDGHLTPGEFLAHTHSTADGESHWVGLRQKTSRPGQQTVAWASKMLKPAEAADLLHRLHAEGAKVGSEGHQLMKQHPAKYGAYRAPKGGVVVRGTFYGAGQLIPDLTQFGADTDARPVQSPPKKSKRQRWRLAAKTIRASFGC